ncbi:MAG: hypothetical protein CMA27_04750 [Euryarchaeota archaeon]|nr:hypothetical protein [Euryarchaeota archaeon]|tara:strand:- start:2203 stop:2484 length:282 start_codon:yes stop_codon:yes gene_type:complete
MKTNYTTGVLTGIFSVLLISIILGSNKIDSNDNYSFHDLNDTRAIIFNKVTGEIKYETIREEAPSNIQSVDITGWPIRDLDVDVTECVDCYKW